MEEVNNINAEARRAALVRLVNLIFEYRIEKKVDSVSIKDGEITLWKEGDKYEILASVKTSGTDEEFIKSYNNFIDSVNKIEGVRFMMSDNKIKSELTIIVPGMSNKIVVSNVK